jgi:hypothetical protein
LGIASYIINKVLPVQITKITRVLAFSTTTPLAANAVYTSPTIDGINYKYLFGRAICDQGGSFIIQYSDDGLTFDSSTTTSVPANALFNINSVGIFGRYFRYIYTNGAAAQTLFRFSVYLSPL